MTSTPTRVSFDRPPASCVACAAALPAVPRELRLGTEPHGVCVTLCEPCGIRVTDDGNPPPPFVPGFSFSAAYRLPIVTRDDLKALLRTFVRSAPDPDPETLTLLERSGEPTLAEFESWSARLTAGDANPPFLAIAAALIVAAGLRIELAPLAELDRRVSRAEAPDELGLCLAAYCARLAEIDRWSPDAAPATARVRQLLEHAERQFLFSGVSAAHLLATRVACMRAGVALALGRVERVDTLLAHSSKDDPRARTLRGLAQVHRANFAGADREFSAAAEDPLVTLDPEIGAAALWNRAVRALNPSRFDAVKKILGTYVRLYPDDVVARLTLGHVYLRSAAAKVAREVFASVLDEHAVPHLRNLIDSHDLTPAQRIEGALLHASCLVQLDEPAEARRVLEHELEDESATTPRRAELHRSLARCALAEDRRDTALDHLLIAWGLEPSAELAQETAWCTASAARAILRDSGLAGFLAFKDARVTPRGALLGALRRHYSAQHLLWMAMFVGQQVTTEYRPFHGFGLQWSTLRLQGANAASSTLQSYTALVAHQGPSALQHDLRAQAAGAAAIPFLGLGLLFEAARAAPPPVVARLVEWVHTVVGELSRELGVAGDNASGA